MRPKVTSAVNRLSDQGRLRRNRDKTWLLAPQPPPVPAGVMARLRAASD